MKLHFPYFDQRNQKLSTPDPCDEKVVVIFYFSFPIPLFSQPHIFISQTIPAAFGLSLSGTAGLGDDALELVNLGLGTAESSELRGGFVSFWRRGRERGWDVGGWMLTRFFASLRARLSRLLRSSSMTRRS